MSTQVYSVTPNSGYYSGSSQSAVINISVDVEAYSQPTYSISFRLYSQISGGIDYGQIGSTNLQTNIPEGFEIPFSFSGNVTVTLSIPSGRSAGTYYVGAGGSRAVITIEPNPVTLQFELNGGSGTKPNNITQASGSTFTMPSVGGISRTGYTANNWNTLANGLGTGYNFSTGYVFTADTILYLKWTINQYSVTFNSNGGTSVSTITQNYNTEVTQPFPPSRVGYTFNGWYTDADLTNVRTWPFNMPAENTILYAKWTANIYTISFESNGGTNVLEITAPYLSSVSAPTPPTRTGYSFAGWYSDPQLTNAYAFSTMPLNGINLFAKWTINSYSIAFINNGSIFSAYERNFGLEITAPAGTPTKTSVKFRFVFLGWNTNPDATVAMSLGNVPANNVVFYAIYKSYASSFKINNKDINIKLGLNQVKAVYTGTDKIWEDYQD